MNTPAPFMLVSIFIRAVKGAANKFLKEPRSIESRFTLTR
jgi:hypothetical protein